MRPSSRAVARDHTIPAPEHRHRSECPGCSRRGSSTPILFGFTFHSGRFRVFDLDPMLASAGMIRRAQPLRDNALAAEPASVLENRGSVLLKMLIEGDTRMGASQQAGERALARLDRNLAQVLAVELQKVECAMDGGWIGPLPSDQVEDGKPLFVAHDRLTVDQAGTHPQSCNSRGNERKSAGEIVAVASNEPHAV